MQGVRGTDAVVDEVPEAIARQGVTVTFHPAQQPAAAAAHKRAGDARADDARRPKRSRSHSFCMPDLPRADQAVTLSPR